MRKFVMAAVVGFGAMTAGTSAFAQMPEWMQDLAFKKQHLLGTFGNWMVNSGEAVGGSKYCAIVSLQASQGGTVALRVISSSPQTVEWQVFPSVTAPGQGLSDVEAKKIVLAELAPPTVAQTGEATVEAIASIGAQSPIHIPFNLIRVGGSDELKGRYWWLVELDTLSAFGRVADWVVQNPVMRIAFPSTRIPDVSVSMDGFSEALAIMKRCRD